MPKGEITHVEIPADDPERARRFYAAVAGWDISPMTAMDDYWVFRTTESSGGGIGRRGGSVGRVTRLFITVDRLEDAIAAAEEHGGRVQDAPDDLPANMGRVATLIDSEGNEVGLWQASPPA